MESPKQLAEIDTRVRGKKASASAWKERLARSGKILELLTKLAVLADAVGHHLPK
jgi:hypothetical protein